MAMLGDCTLCGAASKEFLPESNNTCSNINAGFCPCGELEQLENQIRNFLCQALKKRQELRSRVNYIHNRYFHQIPNEIVSYIFLFYISPLKHNQSADALYRYRASNLHGLSGPLVLGAVCQKWREIAWSTPRLWNSISIRLSPKSFFSKLTVAREWLGRSGQLPPSISLTQKLNMSGPWTNDPLSMVHLLNEYANRWHSLKLYSLSSSLISAFKVNEPGLPGTPILHTINVRSDDDPTLFCAGAFQLSPKVVKVSGLLFSSIGFNWSKVTRVQVDMFSVDECIELFRHAPLLTDCKFFEVVSDQRRYPLPDGHIVHASLNSLCFQTNEDSVTDTFFCHLSLPSLLELVLGDEFDEGPLGFPVDTLVSFFARSSTLLETLRLHQSNILHESELIRVLETTPALTQLQFIPHCSTNYSPHHLFARLAGSWLVGGNTGGPFLPKLQSLHLSGLYSDPWDNVAKAFGPLSEITNSHRRPLIELLFKWFSNYEVDYGHIDRENIRNLVALKDAGIDLKIIIADSHGDDLIANYSLDEL